MRAEGARKMWRLGNRWRWFGRHHREYEQGGVVAVPAGPSDAEVIARVARMTLRWDAGIADPRVVEARTGTELVGDLVRDMRAVLIRSDAGRAVLGRPLDALGEDPVDVLTRERDEARNRTVQVIADAVAREEKLRERLVAAQNERDIVTQELAEWMKAAEQARRDRDEATRDRDEATRELRDVNGGYLDLVESILNAAPESWDGDGAGHPIALDFVHEMLARLDALRVPRERHIERPDGSVWPDATTDPCGFADAADAYRLMHSGCRCKALGPMVPEHAPSVLCNPKPGDRRCKNAGCRLEGEFGHEDLPVPADDPWASGDGSAPVARAWTVHHDRDGVTRTFTDAQHFDTACEDRPHCTIVEHHAVEDLENQGRPPAGPDLPELECAARTSHGGHEHSVMMAEAQPTGVPAVHAPFWCPGVPERRWPQDGASDVTYGGSSGPGCPDTQP